MKAKIKSNEIYLSKSTNIRIYCHDSIATRKSKKLESRRLKSKEKKKLRNRIKSFYLSQKWKDSSKPLRTVKRFFTSLKYDKNIELFCEFNQLKELEKYQPIIQLPKEFDLKVNPELVLRTLLRLLYDSRKRKKSASVLYFGDLSFGALYLLDSICWEIFTKRNKWKLDARNISQRNFQLQSRLRSFKTGEAETEDGLIFNNKIKINRENDAMAKQDHKAASKTVRDLINKGLKEVYRNEDEELTLEENNAIDSAISEHFDNILLHVPSATHGNLCTFFDKNSHDLTILIFNYGITIAQSLESNKLPEIVNNEISQIIENHKSNGFMGIKHGFTKENALTLLAIQEGISSRLNEDVSRGHGLMDFIEHCKIINSETRITLISGSTVVKIDSNTPISKQVLFDRERRIIALNEENNLFMKPNKKYLENLKVFFPGVIIETVIPLRKK